MELFWVVGREGNLQKLQLGSFRVEVIKKKSHSEGSLVVQEVTQRASGSAHGFVFQGKANNGWRDISEDTETLG